MQNTSAPNMMKSTHQKHDLLNVNVFLCTFNTIYTREIDDKSVYICRCRDCAAKF